MISGLKIGNYLLNVLNLMFILIDSIQDEDEKDEFSEYKI